MHALPNAQFLRFRCRYENTGTGGRVLFSGKRVASVGLTDDGRLLIGWTGGAGQPFPLQPGPVSEGNVEETVARLLAIVRDPFYRL